MYAWCSRGLSQNTYAQHETWRTYNHHACTYQCSTRASTTMHAIDTRIRTRPMHALCDVTRGGDIINVHDFITVSWQEFVYSYNVASLVVSRFFWLSSLFAVKVEFDLPATFCCKLQGKFKLFNVLQVSKISK